jgi:hypothetical protein
VRAFAGALNRWFAVGLGLGLLIGTVIAVTGTGPDGLLVGLASGGVGGVVLGALIGLAKDSSRSG